MSPVNAASVTAGPSEVTTLADGPLMPGVAWAADGSYMTVTDPKTLRRLRKSELSASRSFALDPASCSVQMVADAILPREDDLFEQNQLGTATHAVLEALLNLPPEQRTKDEATRIMHRLREDREFALTLLDENLTNQIQDLDTGRTDLWYHEVQRRAHGLWKLEDPSKVTVHSTEMAFGQRYDRVIKIGRVPFTGFIDRVDQRLNLSTGEVEGYIVNDYKGLSLDTPIRTPDGWTTIADVQVGDEVVSANGEATRVIDKSPVFNRPCYRITLSDGSQVVADNVHEWPANVSNGTRTISEVMSSDQLYAVWRDNVAAGRTQSVTIRNTEPILGSHVSLPIDPYLLGYWLGDGTAKDGSVTIGVSDLDEALAELGSRWSGPIELATAAPGKARTARLRPSQPNACPGGHEANEFFLRQNRWRCASCDEVRLIDTFSITESVEGRCKFGHDLHGRAAETGKCTVCANAYSQHPRPAKTESFAELLAGAGLQRNKHVPANYLVASLEQRLELLRGLMDTDGYWNPTRGRAVFVNTNTRLTDAVADIVRSLGVTPQVNTNKPANDRSAPATVVEFTPIDFVPFSLPRKVAQMAASHPEFSSLRRVRSTRRAIANIEPIASEPTQCIEVEADDHLFLAGTGLIATHNCGKFKEGNEYGDDYADQIRLYVAAVEAAEGITPESGSLLFVTYGKERKIDTSADKVDATIRRFERAWDRMHKLADDNKYPTKAGPLCGWCPLVNACPAATKARKTDLSNTDKVNGKRVVVPGKKKKGLDRVQLGIPTIGEPGTPAPAFWDANGETQPGIPTIAAAPVAPETPPATTSSAAAHREKDTTERTLTPMTTATTALIVSGTTAETILDGALNAASPAARAVTDVSAFAVEQLTRAELAVDGRNVNALAFTFVHIIEQVERTMSGTFEWNSKTNLLVRSAFSTSVDTYPAPWGGTAEDFDAWVTSVIRRTRAILTVARKIVDPSTPQAERPWATLAGQTPATDDEETAA